MSVSVCMAVHNGKKYLKNQLDTIITQLGQDDELVVVDDASVDGSAELIESLTDTRIKIVRLTKNIGVNKAFEIAISYATKPIIVLSDQDDVWPPGRISILLECLFHHNVTCVVGNQRTIDAQGSPFKHYFPNTLVDARRSSVLDILDIFSGQSPYFGCCMAFDAKLKSILLPFPSNIDSHDLWIALCSAIVARNASTIEIVTHRRVHGSNLSIINRRLLEKLISRFILLHHIMIILTRLTIGGRKL
jgi:glycosyltransferase involved in cell wall biosynthesis